MKPETIVLVNFDFPPNDGIGGRRWAKLAKGLALEGHRISVVKADPLEGKNHSPWTADIQLSNIEVQSLPRTYPKVLQTTPQSLVDKLNYRWQRSRLLKQNQGTIYDISLGWEKWLTPALDELAEKNNITAILATGAPWNMLYILSQWVQNRTNIRLLVDFRDPWIGARNYGMAGLDEARLAHEQMKQREVIQTASWVVSPYRHLTDALRAYAPQSTARFDVIPHFYDADDFAGLKPKPATDALRLIYAGEMYVECEGQLNWLAQMLDQLITHDQRIYEKLEVSFYSPTNREQLFGGHRGVRFYAPIGKAVIQHQQNAHALLLLLTPSKKDDLTTKFYEYLPLRKPLIGWGEEGEVTRFIANRQLGLSWTSNTPFESFYNDLRALEQDQVHLDRNLDLSPFELRHAVKRLSQLLQ